MDGKASDERKDWKGTAGEVKKTGWVDGCLGTCELVLATSAVMHKENSGNGRCQSHD